MPEAKQPEDKVWVALHEQTALLRVDGRGSFKVSTAVKQFGQVAVSSGCKLAVLDLTDCVGMDSTFMGVLAGWAGRMVEINTGKVVLLNLSPRTRGLVSTLGLDQIVQAYESGATPAEYQKFSSWSRRLHELDVPAQNQRTTAETMLEAHENLVKLSDENLPRFKDVLTFLRDDLTRKPS